MAKYLHILFYIFFTITTTLSYSQQLAFPGAEGYGRYTTGGRGGIVYEVTNLSDSGIGSLRYGIESLSGTRTIVFRVSGTIELSQMLTIRNGNITIAGQTAPGEGICIKSKPLIVPSAAINAVTEITSFSIVIDADNVIIRYMRFRPGDQIDNTVGAPLANIKFENDGIWGRNHKNIIIDHCSMSWAIDEVASFYDNENFTMQWCLIGESLYNSFHPKGNHGYGGIWGGWGATFHHNLIADNTSRNPRFCGARYHIPTASKELVDFRNNVIFNWAGNSAYGGEGGQQNMVNNYFKPGPGTFKKGGTQVYRIVNPSVSTDPNVDSISKWFIKGNYMEGYPLISENNSILGQGFQPQYSDSVSGLWGRYSTPFPYTSVISQDALSAYDSVLNKCGASIFRDTVDRRIINQALTGITTTGGLYGNNTGIIDSPSQVGGWPILNSTNAPIDSDHDGMPDTWENANSLNPNDGNDRNTIDSDGYTMLEKYLNSLTDSKIKQMVSLSTNISGNGIISPSGGNFEIGTSMTVRAIAEIGWKFESWSGDTTLNNPVFEVKMNMNKSYTATFSQLPLKIEANQHTNSIVLRCSPNPTNKGTLITVVLPYAMDLTFLLFDINGKCIREIERNKKFHAGESELWINTNDLKPGSYILKVYNGNAFINTIKIIVVHPAS